MVNKSIEKWFPMKVFIDRVNRNEQTLSDFIKWVNKRTFCASLV